MKKAVALLLTLAMVFALVACGSSDSSDKSTTDSAESEEVEAEEVEEVEEAEDVEEVEIEEEADEPASEETPELEESSFDTTSWDPVELTVSTSNSENDFSSQCLSYFMNEVENRSDGKITFNTFWDGTYCTMPEEYGYVSSGALDMTLWNQSNDSDAFPLLAVALLNIGSDEALDLVDYLAYENPETAAIFEDITHEGNVELLGYIAAGYSGFYATSPIATWDDFSNITFGTMLNASLWTSMGMNVVSCAPSDMYEGLSRGTIDSCGQALSAAIARMFYEVAPYALVAGYSAVAFNFTMNLDTWNSLNEDQQTLFREVMADTEEYSKILYNDVESEWLNTWYAETGIECVRMSEEDNLKYLYTSYPINYETFLASVENLGQEDIYETWCDAASDFLGFNIRTGE